MHSDIEVPESDDGVSPPSSDDADDFSKGVMAHQVGEDNMNKCPVEPGQMGQKERRGRPPKPYSKRQLNARQKASPSVHDSPILERVSGCTPP